MAADMKNLSIFALFLCLLTISKLHFSDSSKPLSGFSLKLIPIDSPDSPIYPGNLSQFERIERLVQLTKDKSDYYVQFLSRNATFGGEKFTIPQYHGAGHLIGQVFIGTPPQTVYLIIDTGGGLIWTQCEPNCINCFPLLVPLYNSSKSSTYQRLSCDHYLCSGPNNLYTCDNGECIYDVSYGAGGISGRTKGFASMESFVFSADRGQRSVTISNIIFGCSKDNEKFNDMRIHGFLSGILGLNFSPDSLYSQLQLLIDRRFSYCLVPFIQEEPSPSIMRFGDDIPPPRPTLQATTVYTVPNFFYYFLKLFDITVGSLRLHLPQNAFIPIPGSTTTGFFIDSGAPITVIDQHTNGGVNAHEVVISAFKQYYDSRGLQGSPSVSDFGLCYSNPPDFFEHPTLIYHFEGADYAVEGRNVIVNFADFFCVGIQPGVGSSILGANHMQDIRIIHDGNINKIQFYPEQCSYDHL
ncbi:hypothetical protein Dsin_022968 [Dipteronia sinensis]|uniref:Peptidase A1 domain-containing protein n=1 Tax=Dipteronia sinensis TaxID=43782 RepID=A0AAE0E0B1_9ROSI|nr:hypothetical protein Dsin_022968 [Dipteronia sinensis]